MRHRTKVAIALTGAAALLMGGLGSTALWVDEATSPASTVSTGHLAISSGSTGGWTDISVSPHAPFDPDTDQLVPGDVVESTTEFIVDAAGRNLRAEVRIAADSGALPQGITVAPSTVMIDRDGDGPQPAVAFDPANDTLQDGDGQRLSVTFQVAFARNATGSMNKQVDLSALRVTVAQMRS